MLHRLSWAAAAMVLAVGCAAGQDDAPNGGGGSGGQGQGGGFSQGGQGQGGDFGECASFTATASQAPAAMLIVLDKSASMTTNQKWGTAQLAVVSAIDQAAFDGMHLGLVAFPASFVPPPSCLCDYCCGGDAGLCGLVFEQGVSCGVSALPQVAIANAGTEKSNVGGVRKQIYDYLVASSPLSNSDDGSPIYDALLAGYAALEAYPIDKRILVLVTDGGFSCTSLSGRPGYSDGACNDWEYPDSVNALIDGARTDPQKPINTFVVGLPGSDSTGGMQGSYATPPYSMRLALSTYAVSGSPDTVDPACDATAVFTQGGAAPTAPCHIDLSSGTFDPSVLADAIAQIRGKALGCVYDLPEPPPGESIDPSKVNVTTTTDGTVTNLKKRSDPADTCSNDGCWDFTADGKVELLGKACADVGGAAVAKVDIVVGCATVVK